MKLVGEGLVALLAALGLALLGGMLWGRLLWPGPGPGLWAVIPVRGEGENLERILRGLMWLRGLGLLRCPVAVLDTGLTPRGRALALRLCAQWPEVGLYPPKDTEETRREEDAAAGAGGPGGDR